MGSARRSRRDLEGLRVLLVEDSVDIREAFGVLLAEEGADVAATGAGQEALELARQRDFDVVVTDLGLPDVPGEVLIREIVASARRRPRIVVVTGYEEPYTSCALLSGANAVLTKPFEWAALMRELPVSSRRRAPVG